MRSHLILQILSELVKPLLNEQFQHFRAFPSQQVIARLCNLPEGQMLIHSLSNYLFNLDLFECSLTKDTQLKALIDRSSFFMFVVLKGRSVFSDELGNNVSESMGNSCTLSYISTGTYNWHFFPGQHQVLFITFKEDYFIRKCRSLSLIKPLIDAHQLANMPYCVLPHCPIAGSIFSLLKKRLGEKIDQSKIDLITHATIDDFVNKYAQSLMAQHYDTNTVHKQKIAEITRFIHEHYAEKDVDDLKMLKTMFNLSERGLSRLIKAAFKMPLHEYLRTFRMNLAMTKLQTTKKLIKEIAAEVGYIDPLYFSKSFKRYHKICPSNVRRNHEQISQ